VLAAAGGGYSAELRAGAGVAVWWVVIAGLAFGLFPRARVPRAALIAGAGLLGLALLSLLSARWAPDNAAAFYEAVRVSGYLGLFVLVVLAAPPGSARLWLAGLGIGLAGVAALALGSRMQPSLFPEQDLVTFIPSVATRLSYPLNYWNGLGAAMALAVVVLLWLGAHSATAWGRALAVAAAPAAGLALFLTSSRGGVGALAVGLMALVALGPARARLLVGGLFAGAGAALLIVLASAREAFVDGRVDAPTAGSEGHEMLAATLIVAAVTGLMRLLVDRPAQRLVVPGGIAVAAAAIAIAAGLVGVVAADPGARLDDFRSPPAEPGPARGFVTRHLASGEGNGRYQFWETGVEAFESEPLRGIGAGGYESWWAENGSLSYFIRDAHSLFVEVLAELGLLGLVALLVFLVAPAVRAIAARVGDPGFAAPASGALAIVVTGSASAAIDWSWELPAAFAPVVVAAAVLAGPALLARSEEGRPRFGLGIATLGLAWVAVVGSVIVLVGEAKLGDSREAARDGDLAAAADDARAARAVQPWSGAPRLQLALIRERTGDVRGARRAAAEAAERDEGDWRVWLVVARLAVKDGDVRAARSALARARALNPRSRLFQPPPPGG
jgi:O-antigen ligase